MRLVTWNLNVRRDCRSQVDAILSLDPDVVALQEVTVRSWAALQPMLAEAGLVHPISAIDVLPDLASRQLARFVATASKWQLVQCAPMPGVTPEVALGVQVTAPARPFELLNVHAPTAATHALLKVETEEGIVARLATQRAMPLVVCGDFNSPKTELPDGTIVPFARPSHTRAHAAEAGLFATLARLGFVDAYRAIHGYGEVAHSWRWRHREASGGFRLDHVFVEPPLAVTNSGYRHDVRETGLSDHSLLFADFA